LLCFQAGLDKDLRRAQKTAGTFNIGVIMQNTIPRLGVVALFCGASGLAQAAPVAPQVDGKYAFTSTTLCASTLSQVKDMDGKVTDVAPSSGGVIAASIGYITFNNTTKRATITGSTLIEGAAFRVAGKPSFGWQQQADNQPATPYALTATQFKLGPAGQQMVFQMVYADPEGSFYRTVYLLRRSSTDNGENPDCIETINATRVADEPVQ
jgi:hypothetical protein